MALRCQAPTSPVERHRIPASTRPKQGSRDDGGTLPEAAAPAAPAPIKGEARRVMHSDRRNFRHDPAERLGVEPLTLPNAFGAVAHAVSVPGRAGLEPIRTRSGWPILNLLSG